MLFSKGNDGNEGKDEGNEAQQGCQRAKAAEYMCQEEGCPVGGGQGEAGQVDDQARTQDLDFFFMVTCGFSACIQLPIL